MLTVCVLEKENFFWIFKIFNYLQFTINWMKKIYTILLLVLFIGAVSFTDTNDISIVDGKTKIANFYPNPATSFINFEFTRALDKGHTIELYNFIGKKVTEVAINGTKITISLDGYFRGIYIFQIRDKNGKIVESGKFQVIK